MLRAIVLAFAIAACGGSGGGGGDDGAMLPKDAGNDGGSTGDAAIGAACGVDVTCKPVEVCCMGALLNCTAVGGCPVPSFACDGPEDCKGMQCCFGNQGQGGSSCKASCATPACHVDGDCPASASKCCPKMFTPSYKVCAAAC